MAAFPSHLKWVSLKSDKDVPDRKKRCEGCKGNAKEELEYFWPLCGVVILALAVYI